MKKKEKKFYGGFRSQLILLINFGAMWMHMLIYTNEGTSVQIYCNVKQALYSFGK